MIKIGAGDLRLLGEIDIFYSPQRVSRHGGTTFERLCTVVGVSLSDKGRDAAQIAFPGASNFFEILAARGGAPRSGTTPTRNSRPRRSRLE
jgi:hypothetical protein